MPQPPFTWRDADPQHLAVSFTYNTNAFFRIIKNLSDQGHIPRSSIGGLLDDACFLLAQIYQADDSFLIKNINNNFNMYLISKVVEALVGKRCYDSERQELSSTRKSLQMALRLASEGATLPLKEKMGNALGRGISFIESRYEGTQISKAAIGQVQESSFQFFNSRLAIDDRDRFISSIATVGHQKNDFELAVIFDDAAESVDDFLWLQDLLCMYPFLRVHLLVNTVQVSINFSQQMLPAVRRDQNFRRLFSLPPERLHATSIYCPFISFQTNFLPPKARLILDRSDAIFIKGANFFETCQIPEKDTYYAFVVYGPISRSCSGLNDFDGVFAYVPAGKAGYRQTAGLGFTPLTSCLHGNGALPDANLNGGRNPRT